MKDYNNSNQTNNSSGHFSKNGTNSHSEQFGESVRKAASAQSESSDNVQSQNVDNYSAYYGHEVKGENSHCPNCNNSEHKKHEKTHNNEQSHEKNPHSQEENQEGGTPNHRGEQEYFPALHDHE